MESSSEFVIANTLHFPYGKTKLHEMMVKYTTYPTVKSVVLPCWLYNEFRETIVADAPWHTTTYMNLNGGYSVLEYRGKQIKPSDYPYAVCGYDGQSKLLYQERLIP